MSTSHAAEFAASRATLWPDRPWGDEDVRFGRARLFNTSVLVCYRAHTEEWKRRQHVGAGAVLSIGVLDFLMELPADSPVPVAALARRDRQMLRTLPHGTVDVANGHVTRRFVPAVTPLLVIVQAREWERGLRYASRFGAYLPRAVAVRALPDDADAAILEASYYGIGVFVHSGPQVREVVPPEEVLDWEPTPAWWWFCESVYRQVADTAHESS